MMSSRTSTYTLLDHKRLAFDASKKNDESARGSQGIGKEKMTYTSNGKGKETNQGKGKGKSKNKDAGKGKGKLKKQIPRNETLEKDQKGEACGEKGKRKTLCTDNKVITFVCRVSEKSNDAGAALVT